jgi:putative peptidoglycan lipid II flippase
MNKKLTTTIAGAAILLTGVGLLSKGFGFLREVVYANNFGLHANFDIYLIGAVLPITLNAAVIYLAQNYFIPAYHKKLSKGREHADRFFSNSFWLFLILSGLLSLVLFIVSPFLIKSYLTSNDPVVYKEVLIIFKIFLLTIPLNAGFSILSSYFQAEYNFKAPAISSLFQNLIIIFLVLVFTDSLGVITIPIGYLFGTTAQFIYLLFILKNRGRLIFSGASFNLGELGLVDKTLILIVFVEVINQLYILVDRYFFGSVDSGGIAALNYAIVLYSLPISIFSLALSTAIFPKLSQSFGAKNNAMIELQYLTGLQINIFLFIPITLVFILFGDSIIRIFYQRGSYTSSDTLMTFDILKLYSLSLIFYSSYAIINKVIYGAGLIRDLLSISVIVFLFKIILNFLLVEKLKQNGLAVSTSICYIILSLSCYILILKKLNFRITKQFICGILFYSLNGLFSYLILLVVRENLNFTYLINFLLQFLIFTGVYTLNIMIMKPKEYLIFKDTLAKYV